MSQFKIERMPHVRFWNRVVYDQQQFTACIETIEPSLLLVPIVDGIVIELQLGVTMRAISSKRNSNSIF